MNSNLHKFLSDLYLTGPDYIRASLTSWQGGIDYEVDFWTKWFETKGLSWPKEFENRLKLQTLDPAIKKLLPTTVDGQVCRVLDVGAGPVTRIGSEAGSRDVSVTATDPLAFIYAEIIDKHNLSVPINTELAFAEDLSARFDQGTFDVVSCINALDHSIQPVWGIIEMLSVLKTGGAVFLSHHRNEAEFEKYSGFHQWNFDKQDEEFVIWNKQNRYEISSLVSGFAEVETIHKNDFIYVTITKQKNLEIDMTIHHRKLRAALLEAMIMSYRRSK